MCKWILIVFLLISEAAQEVSAHQGQPEPRSHRDSEERPKLQQQHYHVFHRRKEEPESGYGGVQIIGSFSKGSVYFIIIIFI